MTHIRAILILTLILPLAGLAAQETATATATETAEVATSTDGETETTPAQPSHAVREELTRLLQNHPPEVRHVLAADPTMLSNEPYIARYPDLADFIAKHPEVRRNPHYYTQYLEQSERHTYTPFDKAFETLSIVGVFALIAFALAWFFRTIIEQKRWNRLSRTQTEVHNKILDRFGSSEEVLAYIKSPAGSKFLESAPIPLHAEKSPRQGAPMSRIMWSIQLGVVIAVASLGMFLLSMRFDKETAQGFFALGAIAFSIGAGFIASAVVSLSLSRRLGLWQDAGTPTPDAVDESGLVR